jgi:hypothetical protein
MEVLRQVSPMLAWSCNRLPPMGGFDQFDAQIDNIFAQSDHNQLRCIDEVVTIKDAT